MTSTSDMSPIFILYFDKIAIIANKIQTNKIAVKPLANHLLPLIINYCLTQPKKAKKLN